MSPGTRKQRVRSEPGYGLIETALVLPVVLLIAFYAIDYGYFFFVALNLATSPRQGVEYSIQGYSTPSTPNLPTAAQVSSLTYNDLMGVLPNSSATPMQVCSAQIGLANPGTATQKASCSTYNATGVSFPSPDSDPESPSFVLNRVDVKYTVSPPIPANIFGLRLVPSLTFHRQVSMRAMN